MKLNKLKFKETIIPKRAYTFLLLGFIIFTIGIACNFLAIQSNSGLMPVWSDFNIKSNEHFKIINANEVNNLQLTDIYHIGDSVYSIGDFLLIIGFILICLSNYIKIHNYTLNYLIQRKCKKQ